MLKGPSYAARHRIGIRSTLPVGKLRTGGSVACFAALILFSMRRYYHCDPLLWFVFVTLAGDILCGSMTSENFLLAVKLMN